VKKKDLRDSLSHLHNELKNVKLADKTSSEILKKLNNDIQRILVNSGSIPQSHHQSLMESLRESAEHFEASHPKLTSLMNSIMKTLSNMGI
jgi:predicted  nucleic acid-binding Zn-ribbon protein